MRPAAPPAMPNTAPLTAPGRLHWRALVQWLHQDGLIDAESAQRTEQRFAAGDSAQHPLVRLASAGLLQKGTVKPLDVEALTEWLA